MFVVYLTMFVIVVLALAVAAVVAVGMHGLLRDRAPKLAGGFAVAARHLNGDAEAPRALREFVPERHAERQH